ncbi:HPr family phosphocarrier protein [Endozoicomonadaceae bacterium StTr2]
MIQERITIINKLGLHARAAARFVSTASAFHSTIRVGRDNKMVDGKSIMSVMMLAASKGTELNFEIEGEDEQDAWQAMSGLINDYFGEGE